MTLPATFGRRLPTSVTEIDALLKPLLNDGQVRQEVIKPVRGRPTARF
jgi:hypothetical protein